MLGGYRELAVEAANVGHFGYALPDRPLEGGGLADRLIKPWPQAELPLAIPEHDEVDVDEVDVDELADQPSIGSAKLEHLEGDLRLHKRRAGWPEGAWIARE